jgi:hypothetical protein
VLTSSQVQNTIYTFSNAPTNGIGRGDTYPASSIRQTTLEAISKSLLYQMACNLSTGTRFGSVRLVIKSWTVRKPWVSPGSSPEYSWTIRRWLSSGQNARLMSDPFPSATLFMGTGTLNRPEYEIRQNTHRRVRSESSIDERGFSGASL